LVAAGQIDSVKAQFAAVRWIVVIRSHPPDEFNILRKIAETPGDVIPNGLDDVARCAGHELLDTPCFAEARFECYGDEAVLLHKVSEKAVAELERLMRAVCRLA